MWLTATNGSFTTSPRIIRRTTTSLPRCLTNFADAGTLPGRGSEIQCVSARQRCSPARAYPATEPASRQDCLYLLRRSVRHAGRQRPQHPQQVLLHLRRGRHSSGWRRGDAEYDRWPFRRLWPLLVKGKPVFTYVQLTTERFRWEGPALTPGKHTIVFDFKYEGPVSARAAPASCRWMARKSTARKCHTPFRSSWF